MTFNPIDFADDTDFERFMLERLGVHRIRVSAPTSVHDEQSTTVRVGTVQTGLRPREELRQSLHPLGFGAAYKLLDMLVEHVLRANGATGRLTFRDKSDSLGARPRDLPVPLTTHPDLWDRLVTLYREFQDARHAVTHRRCQMTGAGDIEVYDEDRQHTDTIAFAEIAFFAAAVHTIAEVVIEASDDSRRLGFAAWYVNKLQARHSLPELPATDPTANRRLLRQDLVPLDNGLLRFELRRAKETIAIQQPSLWDFELSASDRVFIGNWEDVEDQCLDHIDFSPAMLPPWLTESMP